MDFSIAGSAAFFDFTADTGTERSRATQSAAGFGVGFACAGTTGNNDKPTATAVGNAPRHTSQPSRAINRDETNPPTTPPNPRAK
ncbi:hypothetical protein ABZU22_01075 [Micromonospora sp. NPDC005222]|uniref:hypothetical protein n=1 Tax=unclassified Micromonospora TaxID=2617518 RepID=UPI0033AD9FCC